jgi:hypothetical protein
MYSLDYLISESQLPFVVLTISFSLTNYYFACNKSNTTGVASKAEVYILLCHPPVFISVFRRVHVTHALISSVEKETEHKDYQ